MTAEYKVELPPLSDDRAEGLAKDLLALELEGHVLCESGLRWRPI